MLQHSHALSCWKPPVDRRSSTIKRVEASNGTGFGLRKSRVGQASRASSQASRASSQPSPEPRKLRRPAKGTVVQSILQPAQLARACWPACGPLTWLGSHHVHANTATYPLRFAFSKIVPLLGPSLSNRYIPLMYCTRLRSFPTFTAISPPRKLPDSASPLK